MQDQATVLLVSVGEPTEKISAELQNLKVRVLDSDLPDAEERIDEEHPNLVVLIGARGAMELATLIEGAESDSSPRMVIAAERKELAKLRGLNRDIVVSLFALETGDKVVAQRIESLARRAARRRSNSQPPPPVVKKTALGLPSAQTLGKIELKKGPSPPGLGSITEDNSGAKTPTPPAAKSPAAPTAGIPKAPLAGPERPAGKSPIHSPLTAKAATPATPADKDLDSVQVLDDELMSLRPSEMPEDGEELAAIPQAPALPKIDSESTATPPALPTTAKAEPSARRKKTSLGPHDPGELDITSAEEALENLDSVKIALTNELKETAHQIILDQEAEAAEAKELKQGAKDDLASTSSEEGGTTDGEAAPETIDAPAIELPKVPDPTLSQIEEISFAPAMPSEPANVPTSEPSDERGPEAPALDPDTSLDAPAPEPEPPVEASLASRTPATAPAELAEEEAPSEPLPAYLGSSKKKSSNAPLFLATVAVVAIAAGSAYYSGLFQSTPKKSAAAQAQAQALQPGPSTASNTLQPSPEDDKNAAEQEPGEQAAPPTEAATEPAAETAKAETAKAETAEDPQKSAPSGSSLENPFLVPDSNKPSCESLLASHPLETSADPVHQASVAWDEARKLIVSGRLDEAHQKMCEAVALNPESAAVEGLAHLYLDMYSPAQSLFWAEKAEKLRPGQREMGNLMGDAYSMQGKNDKARELWLKMLNLTGEEKSRLTTISKDYSVEAGRDLRRGDLRKAERWYRRAVVLDESNLPGLLGLAKTFYRAERPEHAKAIALMALEVSDLIPELHVLLGDIALEAGNKDEARLRYERALETRPGFFPAKRGLSQVE